MQKTDFGSVSMMSAYCPTKSHMLICTCISSILCFFLIWFFKKGFLCETVLTFLELSL